MAGLNYIAPRTCATFMKSESFGRLIAGPVGSGKTTMCIMELLRRALMQGRGGDGLRHTRFAIVRQTLDQLKKTVLKDIQSWLGVIADWRVSESTVYIRFADVRSEWLLIPLEEPKDQQRLLSAQLTGVWVSEAIELDVDLMAPISGRCGRFPSGNYGVPTWSGIIADTNMPTEGSPWYLFMTHGPSIWQIFRQPGGRSPEAENLPYLFQTAETILLPPDHPVRIARGRAYYELLGENTNADWKKRYIDAEYGVDPSGQAVYGRSFKRIIHVREHLEPVANRLILVGQDFGRQPWSLITQLDHRGRLLFLEEVPGENMGLDQHVRQNLRPALLQERYLGHPIALVGDPTGHNKSSIFETNEFEVLKNAGFSAFEAPTNDLDPRIRAVEAFLFATAGGEPGLQIDGTRCPKLVEGFLGQYKFKNTKEGVSKPTPDKNPWSHVQDCGQYAALVAGSSGAYGRIYGKIMGAKKTPRPAPSARAWT